MTNLTRPDASQIAFGTRTLAARLDDYTNVKDFGAVGDGVTDDTAAIHAAVTAALIAGKKRLRVPSGNYLNSGILATLTYSDWEIIGNGKTHTRLTQSTDPDSSRVHVSSVHRYRIGVRDIGRANSNYTTQNTP